MNVETDKEQLLLSYEEPELFARARKLAVVFPGIGYRTDKPLLYYAMSLARRQGYVIREVHYRGFPEEVNKRNARGRKELFALAMEQTRELLRSIPVEDNGELLFISKSIGTAVACDYARDAGRPVRHILYTPLEETPLEGVTEAIAFHGTKDHYVRTDVLTQKMRDAHIPLQVFEGANHSLETGDALKDIVTLSEVMRKTNAFLSRDV